MRCAGARAGEPLAHVAGRTGFRTLMLRTDRRALIPRPETEGLVDLVLGRIRTGRVARRRDRHRLPRAESGGGGRLRARHRGGRIGGGARLARENRDALGRPVALIRGDLCGPLVEHSMDALVSNPPYLTEREYAELDPSVRAWEPAEALVSGPDGLARDGAAAA